MVNTERNIYWPCEWEWKYPKSLISGLHSLPGCEPKASERDEWGLLSFRSICWINPFTNTPVRKKKWKNKKKKIIYRSSWVVHPPFLLDFLIIFLLKFKINVMKLFNFCFSGHRQEQDIFVRLIDSSTKQVKYKFLNNSLNEEFFSCN